MKALLILTALMTIGFNVNADTSIDEQINSTQNFVVVGTPNYQGRRFIAYTGLENREGKKDVVAARAAQICELMGLTTPTGYAVDLVSSENLNYISGGAVIGDSYSAYDTSSTRYYVGVIKDLVCKKK